MKYMEHLRSNNGIFQENIENTLEKHQAQPVGSGYIDIISDPMLVESLITELTTIGIAIYGVSWWCFCSDENRERHGCPHGMGGPKSVYREGWYSEMGLEYESFDIPLNVYDKFELSSVTVEDVSTLNDSIRNYIQEFSHDKRYDKCFNPALWLHVPREWKRIKYMKH
ncbi:hypothetical protein [Paenibacillus albus]|uniref:Uncharacterized protein n=1 Tax=Paenibacillus albus TaxID=2495582 RepID=A0A3S9A2N7_9BACL|nr:hypothetical protein [Paenibacillus albus]AZN39914.1 hypothetical protein EJC50_09835 [Paenibacillus albus]